jgi:hypothetical protein
MFGFIAASLGVRDLGRRDLHSSVDAPHVLERLSPATTGGVGGASPTSAPDRSSLLPLLPLRQLSRGAFGNIVAPPLGVGRIDRLVVNTDHSAGCPLRAATPLIVLRCRLGARSRPVVNSRERSLPDIRSALGGKRVRAAGGAARARATLRKAPISPRTIKISRLTPAVAFAHAGSGARATLTRARPALEQQVRDRDDQPA